MTNFSFALADSELVQGLGTAPLAPDVRLEGQGNIFRGAVHSFHFVVDLSAGRHNATRFGGGYREGIKLFRFERTESDVGQEDCEEFLTRVVLRFENDGEHLSQRGVLTLNVRPTKGERACRARVI